MDLAAITEALLTASERPLPAAELARLIRARLAELSDESIVEDSGYQAPPNSREQDLDLATLALVSETEVLHAIARLNDSYEASDRAFVILERAQGWKIFTRPDFGGFVRLLFPSRKPERLSAPAMETLAIIAYRQPVTKSALEAVRGVSCDGMLQKLLDRELIRVGGRAELPGRPLLYLTTGLFLEHFGITTIEELPNIGELRKIELPQPEPVEEQMSLAEQESKTVAKPEDFATPGPGNSKL